MRQENSATGLSLRQLVTIAILASVAGCQMVELDHMSDSSPNPEGIVNGTPTNYESWQGVVGVVWMLEGYGPVACSGSLIAPNVGLTAAHCVWNTNADQDFRATPEEFEIRGGSDIYTDGLWFHLANVQQAIVHPDWHGALNTADPDNSVDIGMLLLSEDITDVEYYPLREPAAPGVGTTGTIVGYGNSVDGDATTQGVHRMGETTVIEVTETFIQVGNPTGLCHGDSGGGFFTEQGGVQVVTGINSWGENGICNPLADTWAVNVATYLDDIEYVLGLWNPTMEPDAGPDGGDPDGGADLDVDSDSDSDTDTDTDTDEGADAGAEDYDGTDGSCQCTAHGNTGRGSIGLIALLVNSVLTQKGDAHE